jgi:hypothetical protein
MKFTLQLPLEHLELLNLRVQIRAKGCPHCHCQRSVKSHGFLYGLPYNGKKLSPRALRFFALIATLIKAAGVLFLFIGIEYSPIAAYARNNFSNYYAR